MKYVVKDIILDNQEMIFPKMINREEITIPTNSGLIVSLIGTRRSGKTYLFYNIIDKLLSTGVPKENIVFLNFEDERLQFQQSNLGNILQAYTELFPEKDIREVYFFFDEIQNITGWEKFVRRIFDTKSRNIFITGSNSKLLSSEIATELRGRTISYNIYPFSFSEYLKFNNAPDNYRTSANKSKLINLSEKFLSEGGFPELIHFDKSVKIKALQQYFNVMIYRDIVERYKIANPELLKFFIKKIFASVTSPFSVNKAYNDLKSMGYKISNKYLYEYTEHCNAIFLTQSISKFNYSEIKQAKSDKKSYIIDNGLLSAIDYGISENRGKLLENGVALELIKSGKELFYFKDNYECDFIIKDDSKYIPMQVSWDISESSTMKREIRGLKAACRATGSSQGIILTFDTDNKLITDDIEVKVIPFYKYFIDSYS